MERIVHADDLRLFCTALRFAVLSRDLERRLIGFGAAVAEKHSVEPGSLTETVRQFDLLRAPVEIGYMDQLFRLLCHRLCNLRRRMAQTVYGDPRHEIEIFISVDIGDPRAVSFCKYQIITAVCIHHMIFYHRLLLICSVICIFSVRSGPSYTPCGPLFSVLYDYTFYFIYMQ